MKSNFITFVSGLLAIALLTLSRNADFFTVSANGKYYFVVFLLISISAAVSSLIRLIQQIWTRNVHKTAPTPDFRPENLRQTYRIIYNEPPYPIFTEKADLSDTVSAFTCPVIDASEEGLKLNCNGIYALSQIVQGEIIFNSGRTAPVNGVVVRKKDGYTALQLHCTIDPSILMAEQREQILQKKGSDSVPVINPVLKIDSPTPLPSSQPKNVCRMKPS